MQFIKPTWPAPNNIFAYTTTRKQGNSLYPYSSFNLAEHVGDEPQHVSSNRMLLTKSLQLPNEPIWLEQVHSNKVIIADKPQDNSNQTADACITKSSDIVCVVMTADCLPILLCNQAGTKVAAVHAGWRGLANGIIENTISHLDESPGNLLAWMGPAIGPDAFEVSDDVLQSFIESDPKANVAFQPKPGVKNKWLANLYALAERRLNKLGITAVYGGEYCTFSDQQNFYSYRRDQGVTGRMATLIWFSA